MTPILIVLLVLAMAATAYVLVRGVIAMASGKDVTGEQQQECNAARHGAQDRRRALTADVSVVRVAFGPACTAASTAALDSGVHGRR